jgi:hypothetical protein
MWWSAKRIFFGSELQLVLEHRLDPQLVGEPRQHRLAEHLPTLREGLQRREQDALELHERLLIEDDVVDVLDPNSCALAAELDGEHRKAVVVFDAREALFLAGGDRARHP